MSQPNQQEPQPGEVPYQSNQPAGYYEPPPPYAAEYPEHKFPDNSFPNYPGSPNAYQPPNSAYQPPNSSYQPPSAYTPGSYPPVSTTMTTVIVSSSPAIVGPYPVNVQCPHCNTPVVTIATPVTGLITWLVCAGCLFFGCFLGCCLVPFCSTSLRDIDHHCPQCKHFIGRYRRL